MNIDKDTLNQEACTVLKRKALLSLIIFILVCMLTFIFSGCIRKRQSTIKTSLSDLGGVFSTNFDDIDFSVEISGRLTEADYINADADTETELEVGSEEIPVEKSLISQNSERNKIRSWGIKRKEGNQPPDADPGAPELLKKYNAFYIGDTSKKVVYLTFDEGYENGYTPKILDVLRDNNTKATFFITGPYLKQHPELVRRMVEEGHIVGNHTIHHPSLPTLSDYEIEEEVLGLDRAFREKFGKSMKYLRPPKGEYSERTLEITSKLGYRNVFWSFAYDDWYRDKIRGPEYAYNMVMRNLHNGAVILLHAVSKDNADALDMIIKGIKERGYTIGTLDEIE